MVEEKQEGGYAPPGKIGLRPILRKKPTHLVLYAGTNDNRNLSPEEILDQFDKVNDVVTRDSPETKLIL